MANQEIIVLIPYDRHDVFKLNQFLQPTINMRVLIRKWLKVAVGRPATYMGGTSEDRPWRDRTWQLGTGLLGKGGRHAFFFYNARDAALFMIRWQGSLLSPQELIELR